MNPGAGTTQFHVLVLEDDDSIAELLNWVLSEAGYHVSNADSLREARRVCARSLPDIIVADLLLPDGLGSDLIYEMARSYNGSRPPAIVMSALPQAPQHAKAAGAQLCLTKPFDLAEFLDAVAGLVETREKAD